MAIPNLIKARKTAQVSACRSNLHSMEGAITQWALEKRKADDSEVTLEDIEGYLKGGIPECPSGGEYELFTVQDLPTCTIIGHTIDPEEIKKYENGDDSDTGGDSTDNPTFDVPSWLYGTWQHEGKYEKASEWDPSEIIFSEGGTAKITDRSKDESEWTYGNIDGVVIELTRASDEPEGVGPLYFKKISKTKLQRLKSKVGKKPFPGRYSKE